MNKKIKKKERKQEVVLSDSENDSDDDVGNDGELEIPLDKLETSEHDFSEDDSYTVNLPETTSRVGRRQGHWQARKILEMTEM